MKGLPWVLLGVLACDDALDTEADAKAEDAAPVDLGEAPVPPATVRYRLSWRLDRVELTPEGIVIFNDIGHRIHLTDGYLSSYRAQLVPCPEGEPGLIDAVAGHTGENDPSATGVGQVESLIRLEESSWAEVAYQVETRAYCKAHYLMARAEPNTPGLPVDRRFVGQSLHLEGTVQRPGEPPTPFVFSTDLASGHISPLLSADDPELPFELDPAQGIEIRIERDLAALFDGLDLLALSPEALEIEMVYHLADAVRIEAMVY